VAKYFFIHVALLLAINGSGQLELPDKLIYKTVIENNVSPNAKSIVIINKTSRDGYRNPFFDTTRLSIINRWMTVFKSNFDSSVFQEYLKFDRAKEKPKKLNRVSSLFAQVSLINKNLFNSLFTGSPSSGWKSFYSIYPDSDGVYEFSKIQYSKGGTKAILYYSHRINELNGVGAIVVLEKVEKKWRITHEGELWVN
jgi:hypothetical protein